MCFMFFIPFFSYCWQASSVTCIIILSVPSCVLYYMFYNYSILCPPVWDQGLLNDAYPCPFILSERTFKWFPLHCMCKKSSSYPQYFACKVLTYFSVSPVLQQQKEEIKNLEKELRELQITAQNVLEKRNQKQKHYQEIEDQLEKESKGWDNLCSFQVKHSQLSWIAGWPYCTHMHTHTHTVCQLSWMALLHTHTQSVSCPE